MKICWRQTILMDKFILKFLVIERNYYLNKLTHFDLRPKKFPVLTMAQTLIARIDCSIYHLQDKYIITCNSSFEDYFKERLF